MARQTTKWMTRRFALSRPELATSGLAVAASTGLYLRYGHPYLARGVVGDVAALALLAAAGRLQRARVRHEALWCAAGIGVVLAAQPQSPLRVPDRALWLATAVAVGGYVGLRRRVCE